MKNIPQKLVEILRKLQNVRRQSDGSWLARCPAHPDENPSLHITLTDDRVLLKCFAGCTTEQICDALGIGLRDLFFNNSDSNQESQSGLTLEDFAKAKRLDVDFLSRHHVTQSEWRGRPAVAFVYRDTDGDYWATRYRIALTGDRFRWENGVKAGRLLYGVWLLREWRQRNVQSVLLVEGESDALTLWQAGIPAVGVPGAESLTDQNARLLDGFNIVLWREPDDGGDKFLQYAQRLFGERLRVITPPDGVKDASDLWLHIASKHRSEEDARMEFRDAVQRLMAEARAVPGVQVSSIESNVNTCEVFRSRYLGTTPEPPPMQWLVRGLIPARFTTNLYAESGHGKSYLVLHLALCLITGKPFAGEPVLSGEVLYLDWELDRDTTDYRWWKVCRGAGYTSAISQGLAYGRMVKPIHEAYDEIRGMVAEQKPVLIVVDSLGKAIGNDPLDPKAVIRTYALLDNLGVAVLVIDHQAKPQSGDGDYSAKWEFGSSYKRHYARSSLQLQRTGDDGETIGLVLRHQKSNFGALHSDVHFAVRFVKNENGDLHAVQFETPEVLPDVFGTRAEILHFLASGDFTVREIAERIGVDESRVRHELQALKKAGKVVERATRGHGAKVWGLSQVCVNSLSMHSCTPDADTTTPSPDPPPARPLRWWETGVGVPDGDVEFLEVDEHDSK
jgi:DNA-binding transcriptional ArsR family regulator